MKASLACINLIKRYEGCRLKAYKCPAGVWTIGYGHTKGVRSNMIITQEDADNLLKQDLELYETMVNAYNDKYHWTQLEFDALVSFAYNVGNITGLTQAGTRSKKEIAEKMLLYTKAKGTTLPGLTLRRDDEYELFTCNDTMFMVALDVIDGKYGNGKERTKALKDAGYDPKKIQKIVNNLLSQ